MYCSIVYGLEFKRECSRCSKPLSVGVEFIHDGKPLLVGRDCAKYYGIIWTDKVGPMSDDADTFEHAVEIIKARAADWKHGYRWPNGYEDMKQTKDALGYLAWRRAQLVALR